MKKASIEFLRFVFCMMVVIFHGYGSFYKGDAKFVFCKQGAIGVEFFFVLSGLMLARHIAKLNDGIAITDKLLGEETWEYVFKKWKSIFPLHMICFILLFLEQNLLLGKAQGMGGVIKNFIYSLPELFLVQMSGLQFSQINGNDWYVSALLIASLILYPLMRKFPKIFTNIIAPLCVFVIFGKLYRETQALTPSGDWLGLFCKGTLRAIAELSLGVIAYKISVSLDSVKLTKMGKFLIRVVEIGCYSLTFIFASSSEPTKWYFVFTFVLALGLVISYSQYSVFDCIANNRIVLYFGKLSLSIFLCQRVILVLVEKYFVNGSYLWQQVVYVAGTLVLAAVLQFVLDRYQERAILFLRRILVKKDAC